MKKNIYSLFFALVALLGYSANVSAQVALGPSPYTQNFNGIAAGLPAGWEVYSGSGASTIGTNAFYTPTASFGIFRDSSCSVSSVVAGGFKNYASANAATAGISCTAQQSIADRALGVKQTSPFSSSSPNLDSGAAFVLRLTNTIGYYSFSLSFKLQSLDTTSPRTTTWKLQYAVGGGATATWTDVATTGSMVTGNHLFTNNTITANFGTALDNASTYVLIRVVTLVGSTGTGTRAATAIDDYTLTYATCSLPIVAPITGPSNYCFHDTATLHTTTTGGSWNSSDLSVANVNGAGLVTTITPGTANITYAVTNSCGTTTVTFPINVQSPLVPVTLTGLDTVCQSGTTTLTASPASGVWSMSNNHATVAPTGVVSGVSLGLDTAIYTTTNACGSVEAQKTIRVVHCHTAGVGSIEPIVGFNIFPNPTQGGITVESAATINTVTVSNLIGQTVFSGVYNDNKVTVSLSQLAAGTYIVRVNDTNVYKVIKE